MDKEYNYLNLLDRCLDDQQKKVCCTTDNSIVAAGAGSGKTQVLATRFAWLVMSKGIKASSILTLTFTNKAANEMYARIYQTLKKFSQDERVSLQERNNAKEAINNFSEVHIQTLDSYCSSIVRQAANRYGIRPDFFSGGSDSKSLVSKLSLPFVLKYRNDYAIEFFTRSKNIQDFAENFFVKNIEAYSSLADEKSFFINKIKLQKSEMIKYWNYIICNKEDFSIDTSLCCSVPSALSKIDNLLNLIDGVKEFDTLKDFLSNNEFPEVFINDLNEENLNQKIQTIFNWFEKASKLKIASRKKIDAAVELKPFYNNVLIEQIKNYVFSLGNFFIYYKYIYHLFELLDEFSEIVNVQKRTSGALSFKDISEMALKILVEQKDIRQQEKKSFNKIMIDEFQDNNGKNRDLLFLLSENLDECTDIIDYKSDANKIHDLLKYKLVKDKLFFVGDEKQSIYKFRGAEVSVFNELKSDLEDINGPSSILYMANNYRSSLELLSSFNQMFGGFYSDGKKYNQTINLSVFDEESIYSYEASYPEQAIANAVDIKTHEPLAPAELTKENVSCHVALYVTDKNFSNRKETERLLDEKDQLAFYIANKIKTLVDSGVSYKQIAVLDKNRNDRKYLIKWLERLNIPYKSDVVFQMFSDALINDFYSFLRLCVYPSDINSFASILCSPLIGLSHLSLEIILGTCIDVENKDFVFIPFCDDFDEILKQKLNKGEWEKYIKGKELYTTQKTLVLSRPITETLNYLWFEKGYRYETILNNNLNLFSEQFDFIFELARQIDEKGLGLGWFIDELAIQKDKEKNALFSEDSEVPVKDITYPLEKKESIEIMTIHKSKGLQFDYVFLYGCTEKESNKNKKDGYYFDEKFGLSINNKEMPSFFYLKELKDLINKDLAEYKRVIYVGITRAIKSVYIVGHYYISEKEKEESVMEDVVFSYYPDFTSINEGTVVYNEKSPFDLEIISSQNKSLFYKYQTSSKNIDELRHEKINTFKQFYDNASIINVPVCEEKRVKPSELESLVDYNNEKSESTEFYDKDFIKINKIVESTIINKEQQLQDKKEYLFGFDDFGTLAHLFFEYYLKGLKIEEIQDISKSILKPLSNEKQELLLSLCKKMVENFINTDLGIQLSDCINKKQFYKTEYAFKLFDNDTLITGIMDLVFVNKENQYIIVDYKTDQKIVPEVYYKQQYCYKKAISEMFQVDINNIKTYLYYLRYNKVVDISCNTVS